MIAAADPTSQWLVPVLVSGTLGLFSTAVTLFSVRNKADIKTMEERSADCNRRIAEQAQQIAKCEMDRAALATRVNELNLLVITLSAAMVADKQKHK